MRSGQDGASDGGGGQCGQLPLRPKKKGTELASEFKLWPQLGSSSSELRSESKSFLLVLLDEDPPPPPNAILRNLNALEPAPLLLAGALVAVVDDVVLDC